MMQKFGVGILLAGRKNFPVPPAGYTVTPYAVLGCYVHGAGIVGQQYTGVFYIAHKLFYGS